MLPFQLNIQNLSKSYNGLCIWKGLNLTLSSDHIYCLMGPSGVGKTTLLRILLGLEQPDSGSFSFSPSQSYQMTAVFQEDRLSEAFSPFDNVMAATRKTLSRNQVMAELCRLLPPESVTRPVCTLSGGMKRRTAILRSLLAPSCSILMDEPFTGLDEDTKYQVIQYIKEKAGHRLLLISTHQEEDVDLLEGTLLRPFEG
jgi:NitT/TauT family transport system ATP-binding protein